jgi:hypothetical protein
MQNQEESRIVNQERERVMKEERRVKNLSFRE